MPLLNIPSQCSLEHQFKVAFTAHQNFGLRISHSLEIGGLIPCLLAPIILGFWGSSCLMGMPWWMTWWGLICLISQFLQTWQAGQWLLLQYDGVMFACFGQCYSFQWEFALRPLFLKERQKKSSIETMLSCNGVRQVHTLNGTKTLIQKNNHFDLIFFHTNMPFFLLFRELTIKTKAMRHGRLYEDAWQRQTCQENNLFWLSEKS